MEMKVKQSSWLRLITSSLLVILLINPVSAVLASGVSDSVSPQNTVIASAVLVPVHVVQLGFLMSGIAKEIPVKEGDTVKTGQTLMVLDTPDLQFAVTEAQAGLRAAQAEAEIRSNEILNKYRIVYRRNKIFLEKRRLS